MSNMSVSVVFVFSKYSIIFAGNACIYYVYIFNVFQIRPEDAQRYKDAVGEEYENLLSRLAYARDMYLQVCLFSRSSLLTATLVHVQLHGSLGHDVSTSQIG